MGLMSLMGLMGLMSGSFLNCLIWRLNDPKAPKFWEGRSLCPACRHALSWRDNIPLLSFLFLRGKCRFCRRKIPRRYPAVEILTAIYTVVFFTLSGSHPDRVGLLGYGVTGLLFIVIFFSDLEFGLIPDEAVAGIIIMSLMRHMSPMSLMTGVVSGALFLLVFLLTRKKGLGFGDVKLAFAIGLLLGWPQTLVAFWAAFILGGLAAGVLLLLKKVRFSATMPLGPFLVAGVVVAALWTGAILQFLGF